MAASVMQSLEQASLPDMIEKMGASIAKAQYALDRTSIEIAGLLANRDQGLEMGGGKGKISLLELGFTPTFYQMTEVTLEARVAFSASQSSEISVGATAKVNLGYFAASVNASYSSKYSFEASGSSAISVKFTTVPAPALFQERLRELIRT